MFLFSLVRSVWSCPTTCTTWCWSGSQTTLWRRSTASLWPGTDSEAPFTSNWVRSSWDKPAVFVGTSTQTYRTTSAPATVGFTLQDSQKNQGEMLDFFSRNVGFFGSDFVNETLFCVSSALNLYLYAPTCSLHQSVTWTIMWRSDEGCRL